MSRISLYSCGTATHTITATGPTIYKLYDGTTPITTYDCSTWFSLSEPGCKIDQFYFSNSNTIPRNDAITGAAMIFKTFFYLNFPVMFADTSIPTGVKTFYLIAKYTQSGNFAALRIDLDKKKTLVCWSDTTDQITLS